MTPSKEDYLKMIYDIGDTEPKITNKRIAERLAISAPSVSEMIKKFLSENLITKDSQKGYLLTEEGLLLVSNLYRKHRLIEIFLMEHLHYTVDQVHQEAEILEHTVSDLFIDRLDETLNFPSLCPHGGSIPKKNQLLMEQHRQTLSQLSEPGTYFLTRVRDDFELLKYLEKHSLTIGQELHLQAIDTFAKTYTIHYQQKELTVPEAIAKHLYVN